MKAPLAAAAAALLLAVAPRDGARREAWSEWLVISGEPSSDGGRVPPYALEFGASPPTVTALDPLRPIVSGRVIVRRRAQIEAWDLVEKKLAWKLPSPDGFAGVGAPFWDHSVKSVWPGSPAARAGILPGDRIYGGYDERRAGSSRTLEVESTGGTRSATLVLDPAPEPYGIEPRIKAWIDDDALIDRCGCVERIRTRDGTVAWSQPGWLLGHGGGLALVMSQDCIAAISVDSGAVRWKIGVGPREGISLKAWSPDGPILAVGRSSMFTVALLDPATGGRRWSIDAPEMRGATVHLFDRGRALVSLESDECVEQSGMGGESLCRSPLCLLYFVVELRSGRILWRRQTGGREHGGYDRHGSGGITLTFDPTRGGPLRVVGDRICWMDVATDDLSIIGACDLRTERTVKLEGARDWDDAGPPGMLSVALANGSFAWVDPASGKSIEIAPSTGRYSVSGKVVVSRIENERAFDLVAQDWTVTPPAALWKRRLPFSQWGTFAIEGERILVSSHFDHGAGDQYDLLDLATGRELWTVTLSAETRWHAAQDNLRHACLADPYLIVTTPSGIHVYRRDHADRHD